MKKCYTFFHMKKILQKGFTLIELLVVIAIIGILAAVVLASLNSAREKGKVAAIKSNLKNLQSQAELYYNDNGTYANLCSSGLITPFLDSLRSTAGNTNVQCFVHASGITNFYTDDAMNTRNFGVAVAYNATHYAVDNQGVVTFDTTNNTSQGATAIWSNAQLACSNAGKRLASMEQLRAVWNIYGTSGPAGFTASYYWAASLSPSVTATAYVVAFNTANIDRTTTTYSSHVRCVY